MECEKADIFIFMAEPVGEAPLLRDVVLMVGVRGLVAMVSEEAMVMLERG